jgi:hypothetical protein
MSCHVDDAPPTAAHTTAPERDHNGITICSTDMHTLFSSRKRDRFRRALQHVYTTTPTATTTTTTTTERRRHRSHTRTHAHTHTHTHTRTLHWKDCTLAIRAQCSCVRGELEQHVLRCLGVAADFNQERARPSRYDCHRIDTRHQALHPITLLTNITGLQYVQLRFFQRGVSTSL